MVKKIIFVCFSFVVVAHALPKWELVNPLPLQYNLSEEHFSEFYSLFFMDSLHGWASGYGGALLKTSDGGATWESSVFDVSWRGLKYIQFTDNRHGWMLHPAWESYIYRTVDGGESWIKASHGSRNATDMFFLDSLHGWTVSGTTLHYTVNGGETWSSHTLPVHGEKCYFISENLGWICGQNKIVSTEDGGKTWYERNMGSYTINDIHFFDYQNGIAVGNAILRTSNGGSTWQSIKENVNATKVTFSDPENGWISLGQEKILYSRDGGDNWDFVYEPPVRFNDFYFLHPRYGFITGQYGHSKKGTIMRTKAGPAPILEDQKAYYGETFTMKIPVLGDSTDYTYALHIPPSNMEITEGGTITWTPQTEEVYKQQVDLVITHNNGYADSLMLFIKVNPDKEPFTSITNSSNTNHRKKAITLSKKGRNVSFNVPRNSRLIELYDLRGELVRRWNVDNTTVFLWNGTNSSGKRVPVGRYIVKVKVGQNTIAKSFLYL